MNVDTSLHPLPVLMESERMVTLRVVPGASVEDVLFEPLSCLEGSREFIRMLLPVDRKVFKDGQRKTD